MRFRTETFGPTIAAACAVERAGWRFSDAQFQAPTSDVNYPIPRGNEELSSVPGYFSGRSDAQASSDSCGQRVMFALNRFVPSGSRRLTARMVAFILCFALESISPGASSHSGAAGSGPPEFPKLALSRTSARPGRGRKI